MDHQRCVKARSSQANPAWVLASYVESKPGGASEQTLPESCYVVVHIASGHGREVGRSPLIVLNDGDRFELREDIWIERLNEQLAKNIQQADFPLAVTSFLAIRHALLPEGSDTFSNPHPREELYDYASIDTSSLRRFSLCFDNELHPESRLVRSGRCAGRNSQAHSLDSGR